MKEITFTVTDPLGIHARPAGILVKEAKKYASKITVWKGDKSCDMRKLLTHGNGCKAGRHHHR